MPDLTIVGAVSVFLPGDITLLPTYGLAFHVYVFLEPSCLSRKVFCYLCSIPYISAWTIHELAGHNSGGKGGKGGKKTTSFPRPLFSSGTYHMGLFHVNLSTGQTGFLKINGCDPAICLASSSDNPDHFMVTEATRSVGFLVSCCVDLPEDDKEVKEPCKECGFFHSKENVISFVFLVREFVANTHHTVTHIGLPLILNY